MIDGNLALLMSKLLEGRYNDVRNYAILGLTSSLIGEQPGGGKLRVFSQTRHQMTNIIPHSHRFNLTSFVLKGTVTNTLWVDDELGQRDCFVKCKQTCTGMGECKTEILDEGKYAPKTTTYKAGESYYMEADEIHSIVFSRGACVLLYESAPVTDHSIILQPWTMDDGMIDLMKVEPWMFQKGVV